MNNVSFKGYTNVISARNVQLGDKLINYIAMKLDDNGEKDLTKLREIRKLQGCPDNLPNNDILTFIHVDDTYAESIYFSDKGMCWGEHLKVVEEEFVPKFLSKATYKRIETAHLKAYTLLASLTRRMANDKFENEDTDIKRVIQTTFTNLKNIKKRASYRVFSDQEAFELTSVGCLKQTKFQPLAEIFNNKIARTMKAFFK